MRWTEVYDDPDETNDAGEAQVLRAKVEAVRRIADRLDACLANPPTVGRTQALRVIYADLREALSDPEPAKDPDRG